MYILISIFAFSLLGTVFMVGYKIIAVRKYGVAEVSGRTPPLTAQAHSLEHHLGAFLRTNSKRFMEGGFSWIKTVCFPAFANVLKNIIMVVIRVIKYVGARLSHRMDSLENESIPHNGASSFFLKDITEHKKNLKKGEHL